MDEQVIENDDSKLVRGSREEVSTYIEPIMESEQGNPLIEALPPLGDEDWLAQKIGRKPDWKPDYLSAPWTERNKMTAEVKRFFMPLGRHHKLVTGIYSLITQGYKGRNPLSDVWHRQKRENLEAASRISESYLPDEIESAMITGMSGLGKSQSAARILKRVFPQVYIHNSYRGQPFPQTQIVWLYLSCPHNATALQCSSMLLKEIDFALQKAGKKAGVYDRHAKQHYSGGRVFEGLCEAALEYSVGLIVIDELQNLTALNFGGAKLLLNFIFQLQNTLGVPVLLVSNGSINYLLADSFRNVRRSNYMPDPNWGRFQRGSTEWNQFVKCLWEFQYLNKKTPLTTQIQNALYEQTAGIPDLVGDLFKLVQMRAIYKGKGAGEIITVEMIESEAANSFTLETRLLVDAMLKKKWSFLGRCDDLHITDFVGEKLTPNKLYDAGNEMASSRAKREREKRRESIHKGQKVPGN